MATNRGIAWGLDVSVTPRPVPEGAQRLFYHLRRHQYYRRHMVGGGPCYIALVSRGFKLHLRQPKSTRSILFYKGLGHFIAVFEVSRWKHVGKVATAASIHFKVHMEETSISIFLFLATPTTFRMAWCVMTGHAGNCPFTGCLPFIKCWMWTKFPKLNLTKWS